MPSGVHINRTERNLILVGVQKEISVDKIFEDVFDSDANRCSTAYLQESVRIRCSLSDGNVVLHDGASIHKVQSTIDLLAEITDNRYIKVAKYSLERSFSFRKRIRECLELYSYAL